MRLAKSDVLGLALIKGPPVSGSSVENSSLNTASEASDDDLHCSRLCRSIWTKRVKAVLNHSVWRLNESVGM